MNISERTIYFDNSPAQKLNSTLNIHSPILHYSATLSSFQSGVQRTQKRNTHEHSNTANVNVGRPKKKRNIYSFAFFRVFRLNLYNANVANTQRKKRKRNSHKRITSYTITRFLYIHFVPLRSFNRHAAASFPQFDMSVERPEHPSNDLRIE